MTTFGAERFGSGTFGNPSATTTVTAKATLSGSGSLTLDAQLPSRAQFTAVGTSTLTLEASQDQWTGPISMIGTGAVTTAAINLPFGARIIASGSQLIATARQTWAQVSLTSTSTMRVPFVQIIAATLVSDSTFAARLAVNIVVDVAPMQATSAFRLVSPRAVQFIDAVLAGVGAFDAYIAKPKIIDPVTGEPKSRTADPVTGREPYRVIVVDSDANRYAELDNVAFDGSITWNLNDMGALSFTLPADDPKVADCVPVEREVQVWRGAEIIWWGVILKARGDERTVTFQCASLEWYFSRRVVGKVPKTNLLKNSDFTEGERYWTFGYDADSEPAVPPKHSVEKSVVLSAPGALRLTSVSSTTTNTDSKTTVISGDVNFEFDSDVLTSAGRAEVDAFAADAPTGVTITCVGHTDSVGTVEYNLDLSRRRANSVRTRILQTRPDVNVNASGVGESQPIASNETDAGRAQNRRVEMSYSVTTTTTVEPIGHRQWANQNYAYVASSTEYESHIFTAVGWCWVEDFNGLSHDGWGLRLRAHPDGDFSTNIYAYVSLNENTPRQRWVRMECEIEVPADDRTWIISVYLYPPNGTAIWDNIGLYHADQIGCLDIDQALIVKRLVEHSQNPVMGKSDLRIATNTPLTKVKRTRMYPYHERARISDLLVEFSTLADGMDGEIVFTPTNRTYTTFYPRKGRTSQVPLALGSNIMTFSMSVDGEQTSTQVIVQAEGDGADREEGTAFDRKLLKGMVLEKVYSATPGSAVTSLNAQAKRGLGRYHNPVRIPSITTNPEHTDELLDRVHTGDLVTVNISKGWVQERGEYRIIGMALDPKTEQITYTIQPWDEWSV